MIATLKQHYEHYHAGDLTALKKVYEYHAENCVRAAELTEDTQQREEYLKLAREWTEAARSALDLNALGRGTDKIAIGNSDVINVGFGPLCGLKADISRGPRSAHQGARSR